MTRKYPKVGERVAFVYHGKPRVGTVEAKNRKYMTLEHFTSLRTILSIWPTTLPDCRTLHIFL